MIKKKKKLHFINSSIKIYECFQLLHMNVWVKFSMDIVTFFTVVDDFFKELVCVSNALQIF